jgi:hypothetical protein
MSHQKELRLPVVAQNQTNSTLMASNQPLLWQELNSNSYQSQKSPFGNNLTEDQAYLKKKRMLALQSEEINQKRKRIMLDLQEGIVQSALKSDFDKVDKLSDCMKTCLSTFETKVNDKEVIVISDEEEQDVKFSVEGESFLDENFAPPPRPLVAFPKASESRVQIEDRFPLITTIRREFASLSATKLVVHVVMAQDSIPLNNVYLKVLYNVGFDNGRHRIARDIKCHIGHPHWHYLVYLNTPYHYTRNSYMFRLNKIMTREFEAELLQRNRVLASFEQARALIDYLERAD